MKEAGEFLKKFSFRVMQIAGVVAVVQSTPVQYLAHSPTLKFAGQWVGPVIILGLLVTEFVMQKSSWDMAKVLAVRLPYQSGSHLNLAAEAARLNDYHLAEVEYILAERLEQNTANNRVLGENTDQVERTVFPKKFIEQEIAELKKIAGQKPGYRDLLLTLALKYWQIGDISQARKMWGEAQVLDPNLEAVIKVGIQIEKE